MIVRPVLASLSISSILVSSGIVFFSFCRPSRGPTSTILTRFLKEACCWHGASVVVTNVLVRHPGVVLRRTWRAIGRSDVMLRAVKACLHKAAIRGA